MRILEQTWTMQRREQSHSVDNILKLLLSQTIRSSLDMDYDNFRQMVLGANIKPMKTSDLADFLNNQNARSKI